MKRAHRWILASIAALVLLPLIAAVVIIVAVDPNVFRGQIESAARSRLGLPLSLQGDLRWSLWPLLAIEAGAGRLGADATATATDATLASWQRLQFGAQWRPLLRRQLVIDRLLIDGLQLDLRRDAQGRGNWQSLVSASSAGGRSGTGAQRGRNLQIATLQLRDARISYGDLRSSDARGRAPWRLERLRLDAGVDYDPAARVLTLDDFALQSGIGGGWLPVAGLPLQLNTAQLTFDVARVELQLPAATLRLGGAQLELALAEPLQLTPLAGAGTLQMNTDSLRTAVATLGIEAPPTRDEDVLGELSLQTRWEIAGGRLNLHELRIEADDTVLTGSAMWPLDDSSPALFELAGDDVDLDRYLRPAGVPREPLSLPVEAWRATAVEGSVSFHTVKLQGVTMRNARFTIPRS